MKFKNPDEYNMWKKEWEKTGKVPPEGPKKSKSVYKPLYKTTDYRKKRRYSISIFFGVIFLFVLFLALIASETSKTPDIGQNAQLFNQDNKAVFVAVTEAAYKAERDAIYAGDQLGLINLMMACQLFSAPNGTNVLIIDRGFNKTKVRITSGDLKGLSGWVSSELVK